MHVKPFLLWAVLVVLSTPQARAQLQMPGQPGRAIRSATFNNLSSKNANRIGMNLDDDEYSSPLGCSDCGDLGCDGGCAQGCCDSGCGSCCPPSTCGPCCGWCHRIAVFGEARYIRARNAEIPYAVIQDSNLAPPAIPIQVSQLGRVDPDWEPNFRAGVSFVMGYCTSVTAQYTTFESSTTDYLQLGPVGTDVIGLVFHPSAQTTASGGIRADAAYDLSYDMIDIDFRGLFLCSKSLKMTYLLGASYGNLEQLFSTSIDVNGLQTVATDINFDGVGARVGMEMEHTSRGGGVLFYGRGVTTLLAGEFQADYFQGQDFDASVVNTRWTGGRVVPVLDLEVGSGFQFFGGAWRATAGYNFSAWFNIVNTQDWIHSVQTNNYDELYNVMIFDGAVARVEGRF